MQCRCSLQSHDPRMIIAVKIRKAVAVREVNTTSGHRLAKQYILKLSSPHQPAGIDSSEAENTASVADDCWLDLLAL